MFAEIPGKLTYQRRYKNFKCATHKFFEVNLYQEDTINQHHWRLILLDQPAILIFELLNHSVRKYYRQINHVLIKALRSSMYADRLLSGPTLR